MPSTPAGLVEGARSCGVGFAVVAALGALACGPEASEAREAANPTAVWFVDRARESGVVFANEGGASGKLYMPEVMGAGVALFDANGDGALDLLFANGHAELPASKGSGACVDRFFAAQRKPALAFVDATALSGLGDPDYGMGFAVGDLDNDGDADVLVTNLAGAHLYLNDGAGRFEDASARLDPAPSGWCTSCAFFDYDRDGFLDLYVARYVEFDPQVKCTNKVSKPDYCGPLAFPPVPDLLLHNEGGKRFTDQSGKAGISSVRAPGLGVVCADFDDDGWPDVFVANDAYANQLWINQHDGTFRDQAFQKGVALNMNGHPEAGMGVVAADLDCEGSLDLFVTHLADESNILFLNRGGNRGFRDATGRSGLGPASVPYTGFGVVAFDAECDGDLDLLVANGRVNRGALRSDSIPGAPWNELAEPKQLFLNDGEAHFALAGAEAGELASACEVSRGLAMGDLDDDGDVDLVVGNTASAARLYVNQAPRAGHWLRVRALDPRLHRDALGALVTVLAGGKRFVRCIESSSSYLSSSDPRAHFGLGRAERIDSIEVRWPDGLRESFRGAALDSSIEVRRGEGAPAK